MIVPVLLAGGAGERLKPLSTEEKPKPFLPLISGSRKSMLQITVERVSDPGLFSPPVIIGHIAHHQLIKDHISGVSLKEKHIILEPARKNTAAAICSCALHCMKLYGESTHILFLPTDHWVNCPAKFKQDIEYTLLHLPTDSLSSFGIRPTRPETDYGYIVGGKELDPDERIRQISDFIEKPPINEANELYRRDNVLWNCGIFCGYIGAFLAHFKALHPELLRICEKAVSKMTPASTLCMKNYSSIEPISFDKAIMERSGTGMVLETSFEWEDLGHPERVKQINDRV